MKLGDVIKELQALKDRLGDVELRVVEEDRPPFHYFFYKIVAVSYDKYDDEEGWVAEIEIEEIR